MGTKEMIVLTFTLGIVVVSQAQYYGRMRGLNNIYKDYCSCSCEDITSLIALARALEEKELSSCIIPPPTPPPQTNSTPCLSNFEDLIMKLVNALVYTATETAKNSCCCSHSVPPNNNGGHGGETTTNPNTHYSTSDGGLINVDLLNNKNGNILDVGVGNQHVVGVGLGGGTTEQNPTGKNTNHPNSGEGLINVDLLNSGKPDNVAELNLGNQKVLGVGLGGGGGGGVPNQNSGHSKKPSNSGEGLINLDLLNPKNKNNVADLDLGGKTLLGVDLGN